MGEAATGLVAPERVAAFIGSDGLTLAGADAWLAANLQAHSGALADTLRALPLSALMDDLFTVEGISDRLNDPNSQAAFWDHLQATTGMTDEWRLAFSPAAGAKRSDVAYMTDWKITADNVLVRLRGEGVDGRHFSEALGQLGRVGFWEDTELWQDISQNLPGYRLSKFQPLMPSWVERETLERYLLDLEGTRNWLARTAPS
ncbi:MAG: hypothetical protein KFB96_25655 [Thiocapsa sp.]|uniref:hypothetical protein n=1 Tax=Thiocapsa sp. TaxID=2024551 RepID=UPI001BCE8B4B|nr:hypothetical protein [Thiocapsa sp.]QVL48878.1 MAG: hypothetical protein KFB96_25655 [Thiocapsa sp.]